VLHQLLAEHPARLHFQLEFVQDDFDVLLHQFIFVEDTVAQFVLLFEGAVALELGVDLFELLQQLRFLHLAQLFGKENVHIGLQVAQEDLLRVHERVLQLELGVGLLVNDHVLLEDGPVGHESGVLQLELDVTLGQVEFLELRLLTAGA